MYRHIEQNAAAGVAILHAVTANVNAVFDDYRKPAGFTRVLLEADSAAAALAICIYTQGDVITHLGIRTQLERAGVPGVDIHTSAVPRTDVMRDLAPALQQDA